jgi:16S rRNA (guanine966-N2)-methyltransferase
MNLAAAPGRVRIIGGRWRRHWLPVPASPQLRPTADRVRETLFNWLLPWLTRAHVLDLFAGSGVLGFEAVSRGAAHATLVEQDGAIVAQLKTNVSTLAAATEVTVVHGAAEHFLSVPEAVKYDLVFLDPPFNSGLLAQVLPLLIAHWVTPRALLYLETAREAPEIILPEGWRMMREGTTRQTRYGLAQANL